jgi:hypothetical protein
VFDAGYDPIAIGYELASARAQVLCRIRDDRVFHHRAPSRPNRPAGTGGRPPRHGPRFEWGAAPLEGLRGLGDDAAGVAGLVEAVPFLVEVVAPVGVEVAVGAGCS